MRPNWSDPTRWAGRAAERTDVSPRNVWFMVFEIVLRETGVRFASLNTLPYSAARRSSLEVPPCRFIQTNYVYKKALTSL